jgi:hypothetical protein
LAPTPGAGQNAQACGIRHINSDRESAVDDDGIAGNGNGVAPQVAVELQFPDWVLMTVAANTWLHKSRRNPRRPLVAKRFMACL